MKRSGKISKQSKLKEPDVIYEINKPIEDSNKISFASFEEDEDEIRRYSASLSPEERLHNLYELICISYGLNTEELRNPKLDNRIIIDDPDEHFS